MKIGIPGRRSRNLEDRRGQSAGGRGGGRGIGMPIPMGAGGGGIIGLIVIVAIVALQMYGGGGGGGTGVDSPFDQFPGVQPSGGDVAPAQTSADEEALVDFVSAVFDDVQVMWAGQFADAALQYEDATIVLFRDAVNSGCGQASSDSGPFYCPLDEKVYLDLAFFDELHTRFGAPGDFAQAYVIGHEVAHHVQHLQGVSDEVHRRQQDDPDVANELSVRLELQADCLAGVWGASTYERGILESGDLEEGLTAAAAIGDDRLQRGAGRSPNPDTFTHGTSEQRVEWFRRGFDRGDAGACDTFSGDIG